MRGASAPLRGALLGLLLERPGHGGDLASRVRMRLGSAWRVDGNDVYRLLEGLEAEGLVIATEEPIKGKRLGTRVVYHPTEGTSLALENWMQTLMPREPVRRGIEAKLAVARKRDMPSLRLALRQYERECLELAQMIRSTAGAPYSWTALLLDCMRDGVQRILQAEMDWVNHTILRMEEYESRAGPNRV